MKTLGYGAWLEERVIRTVPLNITASLSFLLALLPVCPEVSRLGHVSAFSLTVCPEATALWLN